MLDVRCLQSASGGFDVHQFLFRSDWTLATRGGAREKIERHFNSEPCRIILSLMEAADRHPEININTVAKMEGLEAIEAVRRGQEISYT